MEEQQPVAARSGRAGIELAAAPALCNDQPRAGSIGNQAGLVA